jgi:DNA-binding transcriptional LysR family regulator
MVYPRFDERDLRSLRIFCAVAHARGFTAAEQHIHLSKASISRHIRELEDKLGVRLCERGPGGFELTPAGIVALESGTRALEALDRVVPEIDSVHGVLSGPLYVGVTEHLLVSGPYGIPAALEELRKRAPEIRPELMVLSYWQLKRALREGRVEVAIHGRYGNDRSLEYQALFDEEHKLYARPDFSPLPGSPVPLVTRTHPFVDSLLESPPYIHGPVANGLESVAFHIAAGGCVGLLPEHYASLVCDRFALGVWDEAVRFKTTICAVTVRARACSKAATLLLDILKVLAPIQN